jgi:hypothetical protein
MITLEQTIVLGKDKHQPALARNLSVFHM